MEETLLQKPKGSVCSSISSLSIPGAIDDKKPFTNKPIIIQNFDKTKQLVAPLNVKPNKKNIEDKGSKTVEKMPYSVDLLELEKMLQSQDKTSHVQVSEDVVEEEILSGLLPRDRIGSEGVIVEAHEQEEFDSPAFNRKKLKESTQNFTLQSSLKGIEETNPAFENTADK